MFAQKNKWLSPVEAWAQLMQTVGHDADAQAEARTRLSFVGTDPVLNSPFALATAGAAALAALGSVVSDVWRLRGGRPLDVKVVLAHAAAALRSSSYLRIDGEPPPSPWDPIAGFYATADSRHIQLHTNFPHHRDGTLALLGVGGEREQVAQAILRRGAFELEDAMAAAGLCATATRTRAEWLAHPQARAIAALPLIEIQRIADADPEPLSTAPRKPLSGVRVLDLTRVLAGPTAGRCLVEHGAEVLAICSPQLPNLPSVMQDTNHGKYSAHLHLRAAADLARLRQLVGGCDVFLQAYRPGALQDLGLGVSELARLRPGIVCIDLSAYGHLGPWQARRGYDTLVQSACGIANEQGVALAAQDRSKADVRRSKTAVRSTASVAPSHLPCSALDYITGFLAAFGAVVALTRRSSEGGSWHVRVSLAQTARWLDALGRVQLGGGLWKPPLAVPALDAAAWMHTSSVAAGQLRYLRPALQLLSPFPAIAAAIAPGWDFAAVPAGTHAPAWQT